MTARHRVSKQLLRHGRGYHGWGWTPVAGSWRMSFLPWTGGCGCSWARGFVADFAHLFVRLPIRRFRPLAGAVTRLRG